MSTVAKTLRLLGYLKSTSPELGLSQFTRLSGYDKASTHRRLTELLNAGFLEQDPVTRTYRLGAAISRLALVREQSFPAGESARRCLQALYDAVRETAHVSIIQGREGLSTLAHVDDHSHGNRVYVEPADVLPFHATASGMVVLAFSEPEVRDDILSRRFEPITEATETDPQMLRIQVEEARRSGFGRSEGAYEKDVFSISAPVFGRDGACTGAVAVALPRSRLTAATEAGIKRHLTQAARDITDQWGGRIPADLEAAWQALAGS